MFWTTSVYAAPWDVEYWQYFYMQNGAVGSWKFYTVAEMRLNRDLRHPYYFRITENAAYRVYADLDLEGHYSFICNKSRGSPAFRQTHRLEIEINPQISRNQTTLKWRNRIEFLKKQFKPGIQYVFRHRTLILFSLKNWKYLQSISCSDEVFYDLQLHKFTQNRLIPLSATFAINKKASLEVFFMIRNFFGFNSFKWYRSFAFGGQLHF